MEADCCEQRGISGILGTVTRSWEEASVHKCCVGVEGQMEHYCGVGTGVVTRRNEEECLAAGGNVTVGRNTEALYQMS